MKENKHTNWKYFLKKHFKTIICSVHVFFLDDSGVLLFWIGNDKLAHSDIGDVDSPVRIHQLVFRKIGHVKWWLWSLVMNLSHNQNLGVTENALKKGQFVKAMIIIIISHQFLFNSLNTVTHNMTRAKECDSLLYTCMDLPKHRIFIP